MNGFLNRLLEQNRGTADALRPRLASLFEPPGMAWAAQSWENTVEPPPADLEPQRRTEPHEERWGQAAPHEPHAPESEHAEERPAAPDRPPAGFVGLRPATEPAPDPRPALRTGPALPAGETDRREQRAVELILERKTVTPQAPRKDRPHVQSARPTAPEPQEAPPRAPAPATTIRELLRAPGAPPSLALPAARPRFDGQAQPRVSNSDAAPTVQVTIGTVEVRAVSESPQKRERKSGSPVMSLEEYLKLRTGGGRR